MKTISSRNVIYEMSRDNEPAAGISLGTRFVIRTRDCYSNTVKTEKDYFTSEKWPVVNPATGPLFIEGAEPGQVLKVLIHDIRPTGRATMCLDPEMGALGRYIDKPVTKKISIKDDTLRFDSKLSLKAVPMIGVIGTAPRGNPVLNGTPGEHGGNMDCKHIKAGSSVFLPVNSPGALLAMGDVHALMGDGEVCICGAEVPASITCSCRLADGGTVPTPSVCVDKKLMIISSAKTLDKAVKNVLEKSMLFLTENVGLSAEKAAQLMSLVCNQAICQIVDPLQTVRFDIPLDVLDTYGWSTAKL